jgi:hypothetical protein
LIRDRLQGTFNLRVSFCKRDRRLGGERSAEKVAYLLACWLLPKSHVDFCLNCLETAQAEEQSTVFLGMRRELSCRCSVEKTSTSPNNYCSWPAVQLDYRPSALTKQTRYAMCATRLRGTTLPCIIEFQPCSQSRAFSALGKVRQ